MTLLALVAWSLPAAAGGAWEAPPEARSRKNPIAPGAESVEIGRGVYSQNCQGCHGPEGRGDGPAARAMMMDARDLTDPALTSAAADGELFWKIATGRAPMNAFSPHLSEEEIWSVVNFIRTLGKPGAGAVRNAAYAPEKGRVYRSIRRAAPAEPPGRRFHWIMVFGSLFFAGGFVSMLMDRSVDPRII